MILADLIPDQLFALEGKEYTVNYVSPSLRICSAWVLTEDRNYIPDATNITGFKTVVISDLRFNAEHETDEDREIAALI